MPDGVSREELDSRCQTIKDYVCAKIAPIKEELKKYDMGEMSGKLSVYIVISYILMLTLLVGGVWQAKNSFADSVQTEQIDNLQEKYMQMKAEHLVLKTELLARIDKLEKNTNKKFDRIINKLEETH
jgi:hypothetical protein